MVEAVAASEGYSLRKYAVQPPGLEMGSLEAGVGIEPA